MGMAASQCRLLLLTARKSDLELRGQQITQRKMTLAMQSEEVAMELTRALSNRILEFNWGIDLNENKTLKQTLTYAALTSANNDLITQTARLITSDGDIVVNTLEQANGNYTDPTLKKMLWADTVDANGNPISVQFAALDKNGYIVQTDAGLQYGFVSPDLGKRVISANGMLSDTYLFQNALRTGTLRIQQGKLDTNKVFNDDGTTTEAEIAGPRTWRTFDWRGNEAFTDSYDKSDDDLAQAVYETKMAKIQSLDKQFDVELKQIETQQKACQTELESVGKVLEKNIEQSFKIFS